MGSKLTPTTILVAALGGEGGSVLADWIVASAIRAGLPAQSTSVPGVAQRTGATSYYIELLPQPAPAGMEPVFALVPIAGRVDVVISSELLESGRLLERGFISPDRTIFISSSSRVLTTMEKMQMGDGRFEDERIHETAHQLARTYIHLDLERLALDNGTIISATMFGALAGAGAFPWDRSVCEEVIREGGRGIKQSLAGFAAAFDAVREGQTLAAEKTPAAEEKPAPQAADAPAPDTPPGFGDLPADVRGLVAHGLARVIDYQDEAYGELYLERMRALVAAAPSASDPLVGHALGEAARRLALWMAYEDIPRVAELKTRGDRFARIRKEAEMQPGQLLRVYEYLKPGAEEIADMLPKTWGERIMKRLEAGKGLPFTGRGLALSTTSVTGYYMMRAMARFARIRTGSLRYHQEQEAIGKWLDAMTKALARSPDFAGALAELPRLRKGYGETQARGRRNYTAVFDTIVIPAVSAGAEAAAAAWLRKAVGAALADPESEKLAGVLAEGAEQTAAIAAQ
ncbi:MAG: indolepyruvate oxidoreductase subunit beta family protein [Hyphomicrobiales bacterium]|nr:indolepyruvate oxidoreductase subunit beta family protein [Hyphomicrobiales bacterium]